jgi:hypothetical protein
MVRGLAQPALTLICRSGCCENICRPAHSKLTEWRAAVEHRAMGFNRRKLKRSVRPHEVQKTNTSFWCSPPIGLLNIRPRE